jgi:hypothetical protein
MLARDGNAIHSFKKMILDAAISDPRGNGRQKHRMIVLQNICGFGEQHGWCSIGDTFSVAYIDDLELYWVRVAI